MPTLLPTGTGSGCELYCYADDLALADGDLVANFEDEATGTDLLCSSSKPVYKTAILNGKAVVRWNGSQNPLTASRSIAGVRCGWIVAKYSGASWAVDFPGLLSSLASYALLVGNTTGDAIWFNPALLVAPDLFEYRSNDRIYPSASAPGPLNAFKLIFFRVWGDPLTLDGVSLGQDRGFTARKWTGDVALLALYSRDFVEEEIRSLSKTVAANFALTLADVYEYSADVDGHGENPDQMINFYDPPEGDRISEVVTASKRTIDLKFSAANQIETQYLKSFHAAHYGPATPFIYRDYRVTPPEDIEGYFDSQYDLGGANNNFNYQFTFRER